MSNNSFAAMSSKHRRIMFIVVITSVIVLATSMLSFKSNLDISLRNNIVLRLTDVMESQRALVKAHMVGMKRELDIDVAALEQQGLGDVAQVREHLDRSVASSSFTWLSFADAEGNLWRTNGEWYNAASSAAFASVREAKDYVSIQNDAVIVSVPIMEKNGEFGGMLSGGYPVSKLTEYASDFVRKYDSCIFIVRRNGEFITSNGNTTRLTGKWNTLGQLFAGAVFHDDNSAETLFENMSVAVSSKVTVSIGGKKLLMAYTPMEISDWYLFSVVPYSFVDRDASRISGDVYDIAIKLTAAFSLLLGYLLFANRSQMELMTEQQKEMRAAATRYRLISARSKDVILEYDLKKGFVVHSENAGVLGTAAFGKVNFMQTVVSRGVVHPEDAGILHETVQAVSHGSMEDAEIELRAKLDGNHYSWYRINMACVFTDAGKPWRVIARGNNIDQQKREQQQLEQRAVRDPLTRLYNKGATRSEIDRILSCDSTGHALLIVDVDNFKRFNDTYGHMFGDKVLTAAADQLTALFRSSDVVGRVGGDEFMVFCRDIGGAEHAMQCAQKVCEMFHSVGSTLEPQVETSCSVGVALCPMHGKDFDHLYPHADVALYNIKKSGKDNFAVYDEQQEQPAIGH